MPGSNKATVPRTHITSHKNHFQAHIYYLWTYKLNSNLARLYVKPQYKYSTVHKNHISLYISQLEITSNSVSLHLKYQLVCMSCILQQNVYLLYARLDIPVLLSYLLSKVDYCFSLCTVIYDLPFWRAFSFSAYIKAYYVDMLCRFYRKWRLSGLLILAWYDWCSIIFISAACFLFFYEKIESVFCAVIVSIWR